MSSTYEKIKVVILILLIALFAGQVMKLADGILNMPDVHVSHSTGKCVEVLNYAEGDRYSCDNLPSKYNRVWVQ